MIRIAKRNYYDSQIVRVRNNIKDTCKLINEVINKNTKRALPSQFKTDEKVVSDSKEIADKFCKYFTNIGINLPIKIPSIDTSFRISLGTSITETIWLKPVTHAELEYVCMTFKSGKVPALAIYPCILSRILLSTIYKMSGRSLSVYKDTSASHKYPRTLIKNEHEFCKLRLKCTQIVVQ